MRSSEAIREEFYRITKQMVNRAFSKKYIKKYEFTDEQLNEILEIDEFLQRVSKDNSDEMLKTMGKNYNRYFVVMIKMSMEYKGETYDICYHKNYNADEAFGEDAKTQYLAAKAIYLMNECRHAEVFFCVNLLRARYREDFGFSLVERIKKNCALSSSIYLDLDLPEYLVNLDDESLLSAFDEQFEELLRCLPMDIVRSGSGLHLYLEIESLSMEKEAQREQWIYLMKELGILLSSWGADYRCMDIVRVLRPINVMNRKKKYGNGKKVKWLRKSDRRLSLEDVKKEIAFLKQGGSEGIFKQVLYEIENYSDEELPQFIAIDFEDDFFVGEVEEYVVPTVFVDEYRVVIKKEQEEEQKQKEKQTAKRTVLTNNRENKTSTIHNVNDYYEGIKEAYSDLPQMYWQNRDIIFFLNNRSNVEGVRNSIILLFANNLYFAEKIRDEEIIIEKMLWLNEHYFKPKEDEQIIKKQTKRCFKIISQNKYAVHIRNSTILRLLPFTPEELWETQGNYFEPGTEDFIKKRRKKKNEAHRRKVGVFACEIREENRKKLKEALLENPDLVYREVQDLGVSEKSYYAIKKQVKEELGLVKDYLTPILNNPQISFKEYRQFFPNCERRTYKKYRKIVFDELGIEDTPIDYLKPIRENPDITYKEYKEFFPRCEIRTFKKRLAKVWGNDKN